MMRSERRTLASVAASGWKMSRPELTRGKHRLARGSARFGMLALLLFSMLTGAASAQGTLWLVGDPQLNVDQLAGKQTPALWVDEIFGEVVWDALIASGSAPDVLVVWVDDDGNLKEMTKTAFSKAGAVNVLFREASLVDGEPIPLDIGESPGRPGLPLEPIIPDIIWLMDAPPEHWMDELTDVGEDYIVDHFGSGGVVGGQGRAATLFGDVFLEQPESANGQLSNAEALSDAYASDLVLVDGSLLLLPGTLIDSEFLAKGRIGRLPVVLARANEFLASKPSRTRGQEPAPDLLAIGVDDKTALRVDAKRNARVLGGGSVTLQHQIDGETVIDLKGETPHITDLQHHQLTAGYAYDIDARSFTALPMGAKALPAPDATNAADFKKTFIPLVSGVEVNQGENSAAFFKDYYSTVASDAIFMGEVDFTPGTNELENFVYAASDVSKSTEVGTHLLALAEGWAQTALWVPPNARVNVYTPATIEHDGTSWFYNYSSVLVLDSFRATSVGFSDYEEVGATNARQSVAITGARLHVIGVGEKVDLKDVPTCEFPIEIDLNGDGAVNVVDVMVAIIAKNKNPVVPPGTGADLNCNGLVDFFDVHLTIDEALK